MSVCRVRLLFVAWCLLAAAALGQNAPAPGASSNNESPPSAVPRQNSSLPPSDWSTLAVSLEQRLSRMLPCDPRVRSSIDEVSRASAAHIALQDGYWRQLIEKSADQVDAATRILAELEAASEEWRSDSDASTRNRSDTEAQAAALSDSAAKIPALAPAKRTLDSLLQSVQRAADQSARRRDEAAALLTDLREWIGAKQSSQAAMEAMIRELSLEGQRWRDYYTARTARAQLECAIIDPKNPAARAAAPPSTPAAKTVPQASNPNEPQPRGSPTKESR
jgi:hypothetical protein